LGFTIMLATTQAQELTQKETEYINKFDAIINKKLGDTSTLRFLVNNIHSLNAKNSKFPFIYYEKGFEISENINNAYWNGELNLVLSRLYKEIQDRDKAEQALEQAVQDFKAANNQTKELESRIRLSHQYGGNNAANRALAEAHKAIELCNRIGSQKGLAKVNMLMAGLHINFGKENEAIEYLRKARAIFYNLNDIQGVCLTHADEATCYMRLFQFENALEQINKAISMAEKNSSWGYVKFLQYVQRRGQIYGYARSYDKSLKDLNYVDSLTNNVDSLDFYYLNSHLRGGMIYRSGELEKSKRLHLEIINKPDSKYNSWLPNAYMYLSLIYEKQMRFDSAYYWHMKFHELEGKRDYQQSLVQMENLNTHYETEKKEAVIEAQKTELTQQRTIKFLSFTLAGILGLLFFQSFRNVKAKKRVNDKLKKTNSLLDAKNHQNELLLKEIHHRVKNNLQTISSLLYLQSSNVTDEEAKNTINISQKRVESIALIHKNLYQNHDLSSLNLKDYLSKLAENLLQSYETTQRITINVNMAEVKIDIDTAIPLGLIINELITNSLKYAFPNGEKGIINIDFWRRDNQSKLKVSDNGIGKSADSKENFGSKLISLLTKQLGGTISSSNDSGYWTEITFPTEL